MASNNWPDIPYSLNTSHRMSWDMQSNRFSRSTKSMQTDWTNFYAHFSNELVQYNLSHHQTSMQHCRDMSARVTPQHPGWISSSPATLPRSSCSTQSVTSPQVISESSPSASLFFHTENVTVGLRYSLSVPSTALPMSSVEVSDIPPPLWDQKSCSVV